MKTIKTKLNWSEARAALETHYNMDGACLSPKQVLRVLALCIDITASSTLDKRHRKITEFFRPSARWCSRKILEMYYFDYIKLLEIIEGNPVLSFVHEPTKTGFNPVRIGVISTNFLLEDETSFEVTDKEYKELMIYHRNKSKHGIKVCSNDGISINATEEVLRGEILRHFIEKDEMNGEFRTPEQLELDLECQLKIVRKINLSGSLDPKRASRESRASSRYTCLCSVVNKYVEIDGEQTVEMDQHATYFTLMPQVLINRTEESSKNDAFWVEIAKFKRIVAEEPNIYEYISSKTGVSVRDIKRETNAFFCDYSKWRTSKSLISSFFEVEFPYLNEFCIPNLRSKNGPYSEFNKLESSIFSESAKEIIKLGLKAITKYDSLVVKKKDLDVASTILDERFKRAGVSNRTKIKENIKTIETETDRGEKREDRRRAAGENEERIDKEGIAQNFESSHTKGWKVDRPTFVRLDSRGRWVCTVKRQPFAQNKQESLEEFQSRVFAITGTKPIKKELQDEDATR